MIVGDHQYRMGSIR